ncbi:MAG: isoaspartyl peptidase/L-asparaginase [Bacteroidota bacterium]
MEWGDASLPVASGSRPLAGPCVMIHGGAWDIPTDEVDAHLDGLHRALARARQRLLAGRSALDVVVETVAVLESHPAFDAGRGAVLDRDGRPQLDAGVMDGPALRWGAVANVRTVANPVRLAARLVDADGQARLMVGEGAERFAAELGLPHVSPESFIVPRERARFDALRSRQGFHTSGAFSGTTPEASGDAAPRGTVGCVALDVEGRLAAATSTGGAPYTRPGRVGDTPVVGAGFWADPHAALSATGWGEAISTVQLCARAAGDIETGTEPEAAASAHLVRMRDLVRWPGAAPATGGLIALDARGRAGWAFTTPRMARGSWSEASGAWAAVDR